MKYSLYFIKRILALVIVILLAVGASACVGNPNNTNNTQDDDGGSVFQDDKATKGSLDHTNDTPDGEDDSVIHYDTAINEGEVNDYHGIDMSSKKIGGLLRLQIREKIRWLEEGPQDYPYPLPEVRWAAERGKYYLETHQTAVYFEQNPTSAQVEDLHQLGIILDLESWIPPVENHPYGFLRATVPIYTIDELASKSYIMRLASIEGGFFNHVGMLVG